MAANHVPPVFFKARDVVDFKTLTEYEVYARVKDIINTENVIGCQRIGGLWRIYVKSTECRIKLLTNKLTIRDQLINVYNENPFRSGAMSPDEKVVKVTIKDIPLSKDNSCIEAFLQAKGIVLNRPIQYGKIRNPETKELTECYSGDRILFTKPFNQDIQRIVYFGSKEQECSMTINHCRRWICCALTVFLQNTSGQSAAVQLLASYVVCKGIRQEMLAVMHPSKNLTRM